MKRWAVIVTLAYALLWLVLAMPVVWLAFGFDWFLAEPSFTSLEVGDLKDIFQQPFLWLVFAISIVCQIVLLMVPVSAATERPRARRHILWPVVAITFLLANLVLWGGLSLVSLAFGEEAVITPLNGFGELIAYTLERGPTARVLGPSPDLSWGWQALLMWLLLVGVVWLGWGWFFYRYYRTADGEGWIRQWLRRLLKGSVLELLIALPTHIALRSRGDCCAPFGSFMGIVTGLAVMLMCFGPGVMFLYLDRARRLRSGKKTKIPDTLSTAEVDRTNANT
jgi:hypothetical protein